MPSTLNVFLLCAVMLAALLHCAPGVPLDDAPTDGPAGDPSGDLSGDPSFEEGDNPLDQLNNVWEAAIEAIRGHKAAFEDEFQMKYIILGNYKTPSIPDACPHSNFRKEVYLRNFAQGLLTYTVLLKHVEKEYPRKYSSQLDNLIIKIKEKMRHQEKVTALTSSQEEQLLHDIDRPNAFDRKMTAHSIVYNLRNFLVDCKRFIINKLRSPEEV
uniref:Interleukin-6 n=1 Tax=Lutjanus sanguineus TaxID=264213 RepID=T1RM14_9TELE|nr:interleukin-6 [Lutjanus sanguineus]